MDDFHKSSREILGVGLAGTTPGPVVVVCGSGTVETCTICPLSLLESSDVGWIRFSVVCCGSSAMLALEIGLINGVLDTSVLVEVGWTAVWEGSSELSAVNVVVEVGWTVVWEGSSELSAANMVVEVGWTLIWEGSSECSAANLVVEVGWTVVWEGSGELSATNMVEASYVATDSGGLVVMEGNALEKTAVGIGLLVTEGNVFKVGVDVAAEGVLVVEGTEVEKAAAIGGSLVLEENAKTEVVAVDIATSGGLLLAMVDEKLAGGSSICGVAPLTSLADTKVLVAVISWVWASAWGSLAEIEAVTVDGRDGLQQVTLAFWVVAIGYVGTVDMWIPAG